MGSQSILLAEGGTLSGRSLILVKVGLADDTQGDGAASAKDMPITMARTAMGVATNQASSLRTGLSLTCFREHYSILLRYLQAYAFILFSYRVVDRLCVIAT